MTDYREKILEILKTSNAEKPAYLKILELFDIDLADLDPKPSGLHCDPKRPPDGVMMTQEQWTAYRAKKIEMMVAGARTKIAYNHGAPAQPIPAERDGKLVTLLFYDKGDIGAGYDDAGNRFEALTSFFRIGSEVLGYSFTRMSEYKTSGNPMEYRFNNDRQFLRAKKVILRFPYREP